MKQNQSKRCRVFMLLTLIFALAAVFQLQARIRLESRDKAIAVVMLQDDIQKLSEIGGTPIEQWYQMLANSGMSAVIVPSEQLDNHDVTEPIADAGMQVAQMGGEGRPGLYFAPLEYAAPRSHPRTQAVFGRWWKTIRKPAAFYRKATL